MGGRRTRRRRLRGRGEHVRREREAKEGGEEQTQTHDDDTRANNIFNLVFIEHRSSIPTQQQRPSTFQESLHDAVDRHTTRCARTYTLPRKKLKNRYSTSLGQRRRQAGGGRASTENNIASTKRAGETAAREEHWVEVKLLSRGRLGHDEDGCSPRPHGPCPTFWRARGKRQKASTGWCEVCRFSPMRNRTSVATVLPRRRRKAGSAKTQ